MLLLQTVRRRDIGKKLTLMIGEKVLQRIDVPFMNKVKESRSERYLEIWRGK